MTPKIRTRRLLGVAALAASLGASLEAAPAPAPSPRQTPVPVPTPQTSPAPPERLPSSIRKGAAPLPSAQRYENANIRFSKLKRVEEVDLDNDGVFEALVEGMGTVKSLPPDVP